MTLSAYFKSIIDQDCAPVVICDTSHKIIYMNPAADKSYKKHGGNKLIGSSILDCHNEQSKSAIIKIVDWFSLSKNNNIVHTFFNEKQSKDVYMIALRDDDENLIGYYEKHEYRATDCSPFYDLK